MSSTTSLDQIIEVFTADERLVLDRYFGTGQPGAGPGVRCAVDVMRDWGIPETGFYRPIDAAAAMVALGRIQDRLPQWIGADHHPTRSMWPPRPGTSVGLLPQVLFSINWADSGPGIQWPVEYRLTFLPGYDCFLATESADCPDMFGACDFAMGHFSPHGHRVENVHDIMTANWHAQRDGWNQERWVELLGEGLIDGVTADAWADEVWPPESVDPEKE